MRQRLEEDAKLVKNLGKSDDKYWKDFAFKIYKSPMTKQKFLAVFSSNGELQKTWLPVDKDYVGKHQQVVGVDLSQDEERQMRHEMRRMRHKQWYAKWKEHVTTKKVSNVPLDIRKKAARVFESSMDIGGLRQIIKEELLKEFFSAKDSLLREITFEDLIDAVSSGERNIDERAVKKVFERMLRDNIDDARSELRSSMKKIIEASK